MPGSKVRYAVVNLLGHTRVAGSCRHAVLDGMPMLLVVTPPLRLRGKSIPQRRLEFGAGAIYSVQWCSKRKACAIAAYDHRYDMNAYQLSTMEIAEGTRALYRYQAPEVGDLVTLRRAGEEGGVERLVRLTVAEVENVLADDGTVSFSGNPFPMQAHVFWRQLVRLYDSHGRLLWTEAEASYLAGLTEEPPQVEEEDEGGGACRSCGVREGEAHHTGKPWWWLDTPDGCLICNLCFIEANGRYVARPKDGSMQAWGVADMQFGSWVTDPNGVLYLWPTQDGAHDAATKGNESGVVPPPCFAQVPLHAVAGVEDEQPDEEPEIVIATRQAMLDAVEHGFAIIDKWGVQGRLSFYSHPDVPPEALDDTYHYEWTAAPGSPIPDRTNPEGFRLQGEDGTDEVKLDAEAVEDFLVNAFYRGRA